MKYEQSLVENGYETLTGMRPLRQSRNKAFRTSLQEHLSGTIFHTIRTSCTAVMNTGLGKPEQELQEDVVDERSQDGERKGSIQLAGIKDENLPVYHAKETRRILRKLSVAAIADIALCDSVSRLRQ